MPKMPKVPLNITVEKEIIEAFKKECKSRDIKVSTKINTLIKEWLDQNSR